MRFTVRAILASLIGAAIIAVGGGLAHATTVVVLNPSFEATPGLAHWSKNGFVQVVTPNDGFTAEDGSHVLFTGGGFVAQTLAAVDPSASYTLSAYVSLLGHPPGTGDYTLSIGYEPDSTVATFTPFATSTNAHDSLNSSWFLAAVTGVAPFNANGALAIELGGNGEFFDNVSVSENPSAAPLPPTWTMLIAGFVGLGIFAYRGKQNPTAGATA